MKINIKSLYPSSKFIVSILLLGVLIFVLSKIIKPQEITEAILNFPKDQLLLLLGLSILISTLKAWRFSLLLHNNNINLGFWQNVRSYFASQTTSSFPGGEVMRGVLIHKQTGVPVHKTPGPIISQALMEISANAIFALIGSLIFEELQVPVIATLIGICLVMLVLLKRSITQKIINFASRWHLVNKYFQKYFQKLIHIQKQIRANFYDDKSGLLDKVFVRSFIISGVIAFCGGLLVLLIARNFDANINILQAIFIYSLSVIIQALSITPGGIGTTEGGLAGILLLFNLDLSKAIPVVIIFRIITLVFSVLTGLLFLISFYIPANSLKAKLKI